MRSAGILIGTFLLVYFVTPCLVEWLLALLPVEQPDRLTSGVAILATLAVYALLRRTLGDRMPRI